MLIGTTGVVVEKKSPLGVSQTSFRAPAAQNHDNPANVTWSVFSLSHTMLFRGVHFRRIL